MADFIFPLLINSCSLLCAFGQVNVHVTKVYSAEQTREVLFRSRHGSRTVFMIMASSLCTVFALEGSVQGVAAIVSSDVIAGVKLCVFICICSPKGQ